MRQPTKKHDRRGAMLKVVSVLFGALTIGSVIRCASIAEKVVEKPTVQLKQVSVAEVNTAGATLVFFIEVKNPNPFSLKVDAVKYEVELESKAFGRGQLEHPAEVPARGEGVVEIRLPVLYKDLFASLMDLLQKKSSHYHLRGEAQFGIISIPLESRGEFKIGG
jgi:LEA14-like dessication related protein